jgi:hypothetical protein
VSVTAGVESDLVAAAGRSAHPLSVCVCRHSLKILPVTTNQTDLNENDGARRGYSRKNVLVETPVGDNVDGLIGVLHESSRSPRLIQSTQMTSGQSAFLRFDLGTLTHVETLHLLPVLLHLDSIEIGGRPLSIRQKRFVDNIADLPSEIFLGSR